MDGIELLKALMKKEGTNAFALSRKLNRPSLQSQLQRFLDGKTKTPRWDTLAPVAKHYKVGVEAFFTPSIAAALAIERQLAGGDALSAKEPAPTFAAKAPAPIPIKQNTGSGQVEDIVLALGALLKPHDLSARKAVASLLEDLALEPADAPLFASRIKRLLEEPGNGQAPRSIGSV